MAALFFLLSLTSYSQINTGTILATVTDSSGSAIANAKVTIRNAGTNVKKEISTSSDGEYSLPYLQPGGYEVIFEAPGFKTFRESNVQLMLDAKLAVVNVTESVNVVANALSLQTDSSDMNNTVSQRSIESLPNIGRNALLYVMTAAGVVPGAGFEDVDNIGIGDDSRTNFSRFTVNGSRQISSEILLDGAPNTSGAFNEVAVLPSLHAIEQFRVITNAFSAEFGRADGGVIRFGTKAGENKLHGSLYEYFRNTALNANSFGNNSFGSKPGGTASGPIARNKTFFFVSYEGVRRAQDASSFFTVLTALERGGYFSRTVAPRPALRTL